MTADDTPASVIDLLDSFFGSAWGPASVDHLSDDEIDALAVDVDNFYSTFQVPTRQGVIRSYSGGAAWFSNHEPPPGGQAIKVPSSSLLPFSHASVLYADEVLFDCPLDSWICSFRDYPRPASIRTRGGNSVQPLMSENVYGAGYRHADIDESRARIRMALEKLDSIAPAIRSGWLIPIPHLRYWKKYDQQIRTAVRYDIRDTELQGIMEAAYRNPPAMCDSVRGMSITTSDGFDPRDATRAAIETPSIYFNSIMAVAELCDARFLPTADSDYAIARHKLKQAAASSRVLRDGVSVDAVRQELLPTFSSESFDVVCDIRRSESTFADWREGLRDMVTGGFASAAGSVSPEDARAIAIDYTSERFAEVRDGIRRSQTLRGRLSNAAGDSTDLGIDIAFAAALWAAPPQGSVPKLVAGISAPLLRRAVKCFAPTGDGVASVVMRFAPPVPSQSGDSSQPLA